MVIGLLLVSLFLVACIPPPVGAPETVSSAEPIASQPRSRTIQPEAPTRSPATTSSGIDPEAKALLDKSRGATNYVYLFDASKPGAYYVYVRGNKIKKAYLDEQKLNKEIYYSAVYLDLDMKTAVATCEIPGTLCGSYWKKAYPALFNTEADILTPIELVDQVSVATLVGTERFENRDLKLIEYTNEDGRRERLGIETYYGLPMKQIVYRSSEEEEILTQHTFTKLSVGQVKASDVTMPADYILS